MTGPEPETPGVAATTGDQVQSRGAGAGSPRRASSNRRISIAWGFTVFTLLAMLAIPAPEGVSPAAWRMLAVFSSTIAGIILQPLPMGAMVILGLTGAVFAGSLTIEKALGGYANPIVWLVLTAFFMARGMLQTGLGRRIALHFVRAIGHSPLGLAYALISTDLVLASVIPSNGARCGGIVFPIAVSMAEAQGSRPGPTARRLGAFLMAAVFHADVIICAMFLTGQASNPLIADLARKVANVDLTYGGWLLAGLLPGMLSLALVPRLVHRLIPPETSETGDAARAAAAELRRLGPMSRDERIMMAVFLLVALLWTSASWLGLHTTAIGLLGISVLLVTGVLGWRDLMGERGAWDVFIWYGGLIRMAEALNEYGLTTLFAGSASATLQGWSWWWVLGTLLLLYFYAHYAFASITAHASAMFAPFVAVGLAAGAPPFLAAFAFAALSNLDAGLTHYGTIPAPIYFGAGYVSQPSWWRAGFIASLVTVPVWLFAGGAWWHLLGLW
ncbi:MAG: DASS family sodium-coupled anion symporter [Vicinamibacterales bacterium]